MQIAQSRRDFLATMAATGAAGGFIPRKTIADEAPP
jgi:hypothetical protein